MPQNPATVSWRKKKVILPPLLSTKCEHHQTGPLDPLLFLPPYLELLFFPNSLRHDNFFFSERNLLIQLFNLGF